VVTPSCYSYFGYYQRKQAAISATSALVCRLSFKDNYESKGNRKILENGNDSHE
jgi:hypothetical protein